jgi:hypothetical protein
MPAAKKRKQSKLVSRSPVVEANTDADGNDDSAGKKGKESKGKPTVNWQANPQKTWDLVTILEDQPKIRLALFSDSTKAAIVDGRKKVVARYGKSHAHAEIAQQLFAVNLAIIVDNNKLLVAEQKRYAQAVNSRLAK